MRKRAHCFFPLVLLLSFASSAQASTAFFNDIEKIRRLSPQLATEASRVQASERQRLATSLFWTPKIEASLGQARSASEPTFDGPDANSWGISASWSLSTGGAEFFAMNAAKANAQAQKLQLSNETLKLENQAASLIFQSLNLKDQVATQKELLNLKEETLRILRERFKQGKVPLQDVDKAEVDFSQQRSQFLRLELEALRVDSVIRSLFVENLQTKDWPFSEKTKLKISEPVSLEIEQLKFLSQAAESSYKAVRSTYLPTISASLGYSSEQDIASRQWQSGYSARISLSIPLWTQMETLARSAAAYTESLAAQNNLTTAERANQENRIYLDKKLEIGLMSLQESRKNLVKSERTYQDMIRNFRLGRLSLYELFDEQARLIESRRNVSGSLLSYHQALVEACLVNGKLLKECL